MNIINQESIEPETIIFDVDQLPSYMNIWSFYCFLISNIDKEGYRWELWHCEGMRSPHLYVFIEELKNLSAIDRAEYKKEFMQKYCPFCDLNLAEPDHLVSARNKPHFKYGGVKRKLFGGNNARA